MTLDLFKEVAKEKDLVEFYCKILGIPVISILFPNHDDDKDTKESSGVVEEVNVDNAPYVDNVLGDAE